MKSCPYCESEIANSAKKCKYCWEIVIEETVRLCPYCEAEVSETAKKCKCCWEWLNNSQLKEKNNTSFSKSKIEIGKREKKVEENDSYWKSFWIKLLMWIPNYLIILCICLFFYWIIWIIHEVSSPSYWFYKSPTYTGGYSIIWILLVIISIIYLFSKTDKKYFFMFKSGIFVCLWITLIVYLLWNLSYWTKKHRIDLQKSYERTQQMNETFRKQWYEGFSDYLEKNKDMLINGYYNSN